MCKIVLVNFRFSRFEIILFIEAKYFNPAYEETCSLL